ncbi:MAG: M48 family metallopeptidase [Microgenomates group bacterium]|nr:M48 family metallopeptidase [Microgenomates group bacterium]
MTIYSQIRNNKFRTFTILIIFIFLISGFFYLVGQYFESPLSFFVLGFVFSLSSGLVSYYYSDKIILFTLGAKEADKKNYFNFYTVAENLSIAAGLPMPKLYVINDPAPNAFATGRDPHHAIICATTGILQKLDRAELEGVIAHELSHIKNYDILLMSIVSVLIGTISLVSDWLMRSFWWSGFRNEKEEKNNNPILFILFILALILAPIAATLIQLALSRKREYLADADGALLTRYPEGLARALEKISADNNFLRTATTSTAHLFIINPFKNKKTINWLTNLFSTHPPIEERIRILRSM